MDVILLERVERLGSLGDVVRVRPGYARNYLIPAGKAKYATEANLAEVQERREELERQAGETLALAERRKEKLDGLRITVKVETNQEGKMFGSVGAGDIARAATEAGGELERHEVRLPDGPLRGLGEHSVTARLHTDVETTMLIVVESGAVVETPVELEEEETASAKADAAPDAAEESSGDAERASQ